jgi:hypothetical protein
MLAFGGPAKKKSNKKKSGKPTTASQQQFEDWKIKDEEVSPGQFESLDGLGKEPGILSFFSHHYLPVETQHRVLH